MPGAEIRAAVVAIAAGRCQCTGQCGRKHARMADRRCEQDDSDLAPLHAIPRDLALPAEQAARLPAAELTAFCGRCHELAAAAADKTRAARPAEPGPSLWELP